MFGRRPKELQALEGELRHNRPEPRDGFVDEILDTIAHAPAPRRSRPRLGLALAFALTTIVAFSAFGGLGYAKSAATNAVGSTTGTITAVVKGNPSKLDDSAQQSNSNQQGNSGGQGDEDENNSSAPSHDQYEEHVLICHHPPGNQLHPVTISVGSSAVSAHIPRHERDHTGPCTPADFLPLP